MPHARFDRALGTRRRVLFSGDAVYVDDRLGFDDPDAAEASLRRLLELPVRKVCAGHGRTFDGGELGRLIEGLLAEGLSVY